MTMTMTMTMGNFVALSERDQSTHWQSAYNSLLADVWQRQYKQHAITNSKVLLYLPGQSL